MDPSRAQAVDYLTFLSYVLEEVRWNYELELFVADLRDCSAKINIIDQQESRYGAQKTYKGLLKLPSSVNGKPQ